jgi:transcription elongation factor GreA
MHDELTKQDIRKMKEELEHRRNELLPEQLEEVKRTRAFGDLSENYEYKTAKQELNRNKSRIRYLEQMIKTAHVISDHSTAGTVGLYDRVTVYMEEDDEEQIIQVVTTVRTDPRQGLISKESPFGKAVLGAKEGDRVTVRVSDDYSYVCEIRHIEKGADDGSAPILQY